MSVSGNHTILVKVFSDNFEEGPLTAAAYPGQNVQMSIQDESVQQMRHSWTPGGTDYVGTGTGQTTVSGPVKVLWEDAQTGGTITTQYAAAANCKVIIPLPGDIVQVYVKSGESVSKGDMLSADSAGKWVVDATNGRVEALEGSGGALAADNHMRVRVI